jgi:hypothetical protein
LQTVGCSAEPFKRFSAIKQVWSLALFQKNAPVEPFSDFPSEVEDAMVKTLRASSNAPLTRSSKHSDKVRLGAAGMDAKEFKERFGVELKPRVMIKPKAAPIDWSTPKGKEEALRAIRQ